MSLLTLPIRRPVATLMGFAGVLLLGVIAWQRIPVELIPPVAGDELYVNFARAGSDPEVVEREILLPLEARAGELSGVEETWGQVRGSGGSFRVRFAPGADLKVRELDLRRLAAELARLQPPGSFVQVESQDLEGFSRFVMFVQVTGRDDLDSLLDLVDERIVPRLAAVPGVARVVAGGGAPREMTVQIDTDRCAAAGVLPEQVVSALARSVQRLRYLGGLEDEAGRTPIVLDGRPDGPVSLGDTRIVAGRPVLLRHVADVELGTGRQEMLFRVNGHPTVGLVLFKDEAANLVRLGTEVRERLDELRSEYGPFGLDFVVTFDAAELVEEQLDRLGHLVLSGFAIALVVLFLYLRQWRAVAVVAVAVPVSLFSALALLYLGGQSLNLITLFGLAVGIGMLVDNSIVVYEAIQRRLERGADPDRAAEAGVRRTLRAIVAASVANAIVFVPVAFADFGSAVTRSLIIVMAMAMLLPLLGSLLVAVALVPLLARWLAAPAALARLAQARRRREELGGLNPPDRARELFSGLLTVALRRPGGWLAGVAAAVLATAIVALPWVAVRSVLREPAEAESVRFSVDLPAGSSLERSGELFRGLERVVYPRDGVEHVESVIREDGGAVTVHLAPEGERPADLDAARIRQLLRQAAEGMKAGVELSTEESSGGAGGGGDGGGGLGGLLGTAPAEVVLSGPDAQQLRQLADDIESQLESIPGISATVASQEGQVEIRVLPDEQALLAHSLTADQVLPVLGVVRRDGVVLRTGFTLRDGREIPLAVRRESDARIAGVGLGRLRVQTSAGVLPLEALATVRRMTEPPATIEHHNGRREVRVRYQLGSEAPGTGPARQALEERIRKSVQQAHRPPGYTLEVPEPDAQFSWFKAILVPVLLLLYAVLAVTFESLTLPVLVLLALPLTLLGATWSLALAGMGADMMALVGALALIGLTVNPAILLVDRMQQRARVPGAGPGAAALGAVRERARPILMTATTTIAGLWPLAIATGRENEIWPPFATIVMGGLITSTVLSLLVVPVGFVFLHRLDRVFGRLGPWIVLGWIGATSAVMAPLILSGQISSLTWQLLTTALVAAVLLGLAVLAFRRPERPEPVTEDGPPRLEVRYLHKIYGRPGPVGRAWRLNEWFARRVLERGGTPFDPHRARERLASVALVLAGGLYLGFSLQTPFWRSVFLLASSVVAVHLFHEIRRARGHADAFGRVDPGGPEGVAAAFAPWVAFGFIALHFNVLPWLEARMAHQRASLGWLTLVVPLGLAIAVVQAGRRTAVRLARGDMSESVTEGLLRHPRTFWRRLSRRVFGLDLPREEVQALTGVHFEVRRGMVGILGPNGAGKTTLLRQLAGILDPSVGRITLGGVPLERLRRYLARWVGYLPQEYGLPQDLTAREYLDYYALLYGIAPASERRARVQKLLDEVGLGQRADERIGGYSGGMRQRVAVARTLLRLPPVIIVDEPTVGLDPRERIRFRNLLSRLAEGRVVLFSTHVVEDVAVACERVIVFSRGRMVFDGPPADLAERAAGSVWELHLAPEEAQALAARAFVVDQVPEPSGVVRTRVLSRMPPEPSARLVPPTLEDGYLWLVGTGTRTAA